MRLYEETRDKALKVYKGVFLGDFNRPTLQDTWCAIRNRFSNTNTDAISTPSSVAVVAAATNAPSSGAATDAETATDRVLQDVSFIGQIRNKHIFQVAKALSTATDTASQATEDYAERTSKSASKGTGGNRMGNEKGGDNDTDDVDDEDDDAMYYNVYNCDISEYLSPHRMWPGASVHDLFSWNRIKYACWTRPIKENILYNGIILRSFLILPGLPPVMPMIMTSFLYMLHTAETPENQVQTSWFPMSLEEYQVWV